jgi:LPXTG-motif cell wall-anchored protein
MTKNVSRIVVAALALASVFGVFSTADAQTDDAPSDPVQRGSSFEPDPATANSGFLGFGDLNPTASAEAIAAAAAAAAADTTTEGGTGGGLAATGTEAELGLAIGIGLLAAGGTAVVASRKRDDE